MRAQRHGRQRANAVVPCDTTGWRNALFNSGQSKRSARAPVSKRYRRPEKPRQQARRGPTTAAANHRRRKPPQPQTTTAAKRWRGAVARLGVMTTKTEDREGRGAAGAYKKTSYYHFRLSSLFCVTFDITCIVPALFVLIYSKTLARVRAAAAVRQAASLHPPSPFSRIDSTHSRNSTRALRLCVEFTCNCTRFGMHGACIVL